MDEKNEMNEAAPEENSAQNGERNTNAPSGWSYSANTNQYKSYEGTSQQNAGAYSRNSYGGQNGY